MLMLPTESIRQPTHYFPREENLTLRQIQSAAIEAVQAAGRVLMAAFGQFQPVDDRPPHDLKLAIDRRSEAAALAVLHDRFPDHGIVSEESGFHNPGAPFRWYLDPLDGTVNYFLGQPYFCACLACYYVTPSQKGQSSDPLGHPLAGVVYAPALDKCFEAAPGGPALCNGRPVRPGPEEKLSEAVIGFSYGSDPNTMRRMVAIGAELIRRTRKVRIFGATGLDLAHVACGGLSGLVQGRVQVWDFAAAKVIVDAAGGYCRAVAAGSGSWQITAASPGIALELQALVDTLTDRG
jgi:myo-inositol-1(or 4)-monophosphatase